MVYFEIEYYSFDLAAMFFKIECVDVEERAHISILQPIYSFGKKK